MTHHLLFLQGGGHDGYRADKALVHSLQPTLDTEYDIVYPELQSEESSPRLWLDRSIARHVSDANDSVIIVAHSLGASILLKYLSEDSVTKKMKGIFLIATPFWSGDEDWKQGLKLKQGFADQLPTEMPIYFYH